MCGEQMQAPTLRQCLCPSIVDSYRCEHCGYESGITTYGVQRAMLGLIARIEALENEMERIKSPEDD